MPSLLVTTAEIEPGLDKMRKNAIRETGSANESDLAAVSGYSVTTFETDDPCTGSAGWQTKLAIHDYRRADGAWTRVRAILDKVLPLARNADRLTDERHSNARFRRNLSGGRGYPTTFGDTGFVQSAGGCSLRRGPGASVGVGLRVTTLPLHPTEVSLQRSKGIIDDQG